MKTKPESTPNDFPDGSIIVCSRGGRTVAGTKKGDILLHRRLPCGFVSFTHCVDLRPATDFERRLITEMDVGHFLRVESVESIDVTTTSGLGLSDSQW
jgi:hypothetical protein